MAEIETDVLVLGGGPAGIWAALAAAASGARVALADKGFCGSTGPSAFGRTRLWNIGPGPARVGAIETWSNNGMHLSEPEWMDRVMDESRRRLNMLAQWGYSFPRDDTSGSARQTTLGADFLMLLRRKAVRSGVRILDYHPALQLLVDADGVVSGASGIASQEQFRQWRIRSAAVVVATGGCAFMSGSAGTDGNTGDGHLMAAEVGAELSGMEFSAAYGLAPHASKHTKNPMLNFATFYDESGQVVVERGPNSLGEVFAAIAGGRRVYARLDNAPPAVREAMRRTGIDPAAKQFPLRPVLEGTVRGTGGLRLASTDCRTSVPGLYGAGDATTREAITGAASGVGGQSGAWAMASGAWAGVGAAGFARERGGVGRVDTVPGAGLSPFGQINPQSVVGLVQEHTVPLRRSYWRSRAVLRDSMSELDGLWPGAVFGLGGSGPNLLRSRQAASMLAVARWATHSALARTESRGMHRRTDHPDGTSHWQIRLETGGLDEVWVRQGSRLPIRTG